LIDGMNDSFFQISGGKSSAFDLGFIDYAARVPYNRKAAGPDRGGSGERDLMKAIRSAKLALKKIVFAIAPRVFPVRWKEFHELKYWKGRKREEGTLANLHYKYFYTAHFGFADSFFNGKFILDIGCGPRGSLEWASMASRRIGLDPLAKEYLRLGARRHQMEYLDGRAEDIPIAAGVCDVVFSFNSLDHVEDVGQVLNEIKRITTPGGYFLLLVEVNHPPTECEPHNLHPDEIIAALQPEFACESIRLFKPVATGIYGSVIAGTELVRSEQSLALAYMSAKFIRLSAK
jgi:2-polyprenyl-3-methyl-5-hydroxy-6-metoxy-1,4-benzoquinol methylase